MVLSRSPGTELTFCKKWCCMWSVNQPRLEGFITLPLQANWVWGRGLSVTVPQCGCANGSGSGKGLEAGVSKSR